MRIALGYCDPDASTPPDWPAIRPLALAYLRAGRIVSQQAALAPDDWDPTGVPCVPMGFRTDGAWIWSLAVPYYVDKYGMCIDRGFLNDMRYRGFVPPHVSLLQLDAAAEVLREVALAAAKLDDPQST